VPAQRRAETIGGVGGGLRGGGGGEEGGEDCARSPPVVLRMKYVAKFPLPNRLARLRPAPNNAVLERRP